MNESPTIRQVMETLTPSQKESLYFWIGVAQTNIACSVFKLPSIGAGIEDSIIVQELLASLNPEQTLCVRWLVNEAIRSTLQDLSAT